MTPFRQIFIKSHIDQKICDIYTFIYKLHGQTRDRARDETSWSRERQRLGRRRIALFADWARKYNSEGRDTIKSRPYRARKWRRSSPTVETLLSLWLWHIFFLTTILTSKLFIGYISCFSGRFHQTVCSFHGGGLCYIL